MKNLLLPCIILTLWLGLGSGLTHAVEAEFYITKITSPENLQIAPGETALLNITLKNLRPNFALYLKASLDPNDTTPIDALGPATIWVTKKAKQAQESQQYFGAVLQGEEVGIAFKIYAKPDAEEKVYQVPLVLTWKNEKLQDVTQTICVGILIKGKPNLQIAGVETDPVEIRAGDNNVKLKITIQNTGEAEAKNVKAKLLLDEIKTKTFKPSYSKSDQAFIGKLSKDQTQEATFYIDINQTAKPGKYKLPIEITYEENNNNNSYKTLKTIELLVEPKPYFIITKTKTKPEKAYPGNDVILYITIKNIGHEKAENVDVRIVRDASQPFTFDTRSDYIGTLNPKEEGTALIKFSIDKNALAKEYNLKIIVRATGDSEIGDTNVYTQTLKAPIKVQEGGGEESKVGYALIVLVVAIIITILGKRFIKTKE
ncbi:MAG: hypothetical protein DRN88_04785 [Candidatus Hydrothermarchaeota archaeon]|nr:MAG: hypothetical protein DRN88_04785 [Candidatus Hydrothermarchaeota archaeon]